MLQKWMTPNPFTIEDRRKIKKGIDAGLTYIKISESIGRSKSGVIYEAKRFGSYLKYDPELAQKDFEEKQHLKYQNLCKKRSSKKKLDNDKRNAKDFEPSEEDPRPSFNPVDPV